MRLRDLGSEQLTLRDLWVIVRHAPRDSVLAHQIAPDQTRWGDTEYLLAEAVDRLSLLWWAKTKDGSKGRNRPDMVLRPGEQPKTKQIGTTAVPMDQMAVILGWSNPE